MNVKLYRFLNTKLFMNFKCVVRIHPTKYRQAKGTKVVNYLRER